MLLKQLVKISGPLSASARWRIDTASPEQMESRALALPEATRDDRSVDCALGGSGPTIHSGRHAP